MARDEAGESIRAIGAALAISPSCVSKWRKLERETGVLRPGQIGGHKKRRLAGPFGDWLGHRLRAGPFTLRGLVADLAARGVKTDSRAVWVFMRAQGLSYKKTLRASEQDNPAVARKRRRWKAHQAEVDPRRLVFLILSLSKDR